jgi:hypothetical protein
MNMTCDGVKATLALVLGLAAMVPAAAAASADAVVGRVAPLAGQAGATLGISPEQRLREELRVILLDMIESGAFGQTPVNQISLSIDAPAERAGGLGVLVDSSSAERAVDGLHVLGTTPGSSASRMGLRSGDVLTSINGVALSGLGEDANGGAQAAQVLREQVQDLEDGAAIEFTVVRGDRSLPVSGVMASAWIPAMHLTVGDGVALASAQGGGATAASGGCGRISIFDVAPRQQDLHAAVLISIDGRRSPFAGQETFQVSAGRHVLTLGERIDHRYLGFNDRLRDSGADSRYKSLTIDVEADTTYLVAARLNADHRNEWRDGAYWDPVLWKQTAERCR